MNKLIKKDSGITLVALVITIIIIMILASISVYEGKQIIAKSKVQTLETNMLTIKAKAKVYAEEIDAKVWTYKDSEKDDKRDAEFSSDDRKMDKTSVSQEALAQVEDKIKTGGYVAYLATGEALTKMGLDEIKNEKYIVIFSIEDYKLMDVIYQDGVIYNKKTYYSLSALQEVLENEQKYYMQ